MISENVPEEQMKQRVQRSVRLVSVLVVCVLCAATAPDARGQLFRSTSKVGTTAGQFLKIGVGARAHAMGGAQVAVPGDISAMYYNPAALSRLQVNSELTFNHADWLADIDYDFFGGILPLGDLGTVGLSILALSIPEDVVRTVDFPEGDGRHWDASSLAIGVSYARNLTDRFSIGFNLKYVQEDLWSESASGVAIDVGTMYMSEVPGLILGASISNFGSRMQLNGRDTYFNEDPDGNVGSGPNNIPSQYRMGEYDLPLIFRIGLSMEVFRMEDMRLVTAVDAAHPNDNTEYLNSGAEFSWREIIFARLGYKSLFLRDAEGGFTWGLGFHYGIVNTATIKIDYGFADYGLLKDVQYVSVGVRL